MRFPPQTPPLRIQRHAWVARRKATGLDTRSRGKCRSRSLGHITPSGSHVPCGASPPLLAFAGGSVLFTCIRGDFLFPSAEEEAERQPVVERNKRTGTSQRRTDELSVTTEPAGCGVTDVASNRNRRHPLSSGRQENCPVHGEPRHRLPCPDRPHSSEHFRSRPRRWLRHWT